MTTKGIFGEMYQMHKEQFATEEINLDSRDYEIQYYRSNIGSHMIYTSEVILDSDDKIIVDEDSFWVLKHKINLILPAALCLRGLL